MLLGVSLIGLIKWYIDVVLKEEFGYGWLGDLESEERVGVVKAGSKGLICGVQAFNTSDQWINAQDKFNYQSLAWLFPGDGEEQWIKANVANDQSQCGCSHI